MIWVIVFFIIFSISFFLALRSLRSYRDNPNKSKIEYSLYLIQNLPALTTPLLQAIQSQSGVSLISLEKLFKGDRSALTIFGPKSVLESFKPQLSLVELEDYSLKSNSHHLMVFELANKPDRPLNLAGLNLPVDELNLTVQDQLWWQVVVNFTPVPTCIVRLVILTSDHLRLNYLRSKTLFYLSQANLVPIPRPSGSATLIKHYQDRASYKIFMENSQKLQMTVDGILKLVSL